MTSCVVPFEIGLNQSHIGGADAAFTKPAVVPAVHPVGGSSGGFPGEVIDDAVEESPGGGQRLASAAIATVESLIFAIRS